MSESFPMNHNDRHERLRDLVAALSDGKWHRGNDLADALHVTSRTLYRDMALVMARGLPVISVRGRGYRLKPTLSLPPVEIAGRELEALTLGLAVMGQADDAALRAAARSLARKLDEALPEAHAPGTVAGGPASPGFGSATAGVRHIPALRHAIRTGATVRLNIENPGATPLLLTGKPTALNYWGRVWTCRLHETRTSADRIIRVDQITIITPAHKR